MSYLEKDIISVGAGVALLLGIDWFFHHEGWLFAVSAIVGWTVATFIYDRLDLPSPIDSVDFLVGGCAIIGVSYVATRVVEHIAPISQTVESPQPIEFTTILVISIIASVIAYFLSNFDWITARGKT